MHRTEDYSTEQHNKRKEYITYRYIDWNAARTQIYQYIDIKWHNGSRRRRWPRIYNNIISNDTNDDDILPRGRGWGRNKMPHWMMISISCYFIQSIQFTCLLANLFEQTMRSILFFFLQLIVCSILRLFHILLHHRCTFYTWTLNKCIVVLFFSFLSCAVKIENCLNRITCSPFLPI